MMTIGHWMKMAPLAGLLGMSWICAAADLSGDWVAQVSPQTTPQINMQGQAEPQYAHVSLTVDGVTVSGMWGQSRIDGTLSGNKIDMKLEASGGLTGLVAGDTITGTGSIVRAGRGGRGGGAGAVSFVLKRPAVPPAKPRSINFEPTNFFATYSAANKPVLTIFPGEAGFFLHSPAEFLRDFLKQRLAHV